MSILLDALKKSEEQRQLGKTPEIHDRDDYTPGRAGERGRPWIPLAMVAVAALLIAVIVWQQFREPSIGAVSPEAIAVDQPESGRRVPQVGLTAAAPQQSTTVEKEARTPVESFETGDSQATQQPAGTPEDEQQRQDLARSFNQYQQPVEEQATASAEQPARAGPEDLATDALPAKPAPPGAARPAGPHESEPVSYWELPQNVRDSMPDLRISVTVYADKPEDRFLLVNGRRLVEKESVDGVTLEEIRRNGAVFRYRNYRFLMKG